MWFKKKTELQRQIERYGKNTDFLNTFAKVSRLRRVQDCTQECLKLVYTELIETQASIYYRLEYTKYLNKFLRYYGVPFIIATEQIVELTPNDAIIQAMKTVSKFNPTPRTERNKLIVKLKDKGWSFSEIAAEVGLRSKSNVYDIYWREKNRTGLSTV